MQRWGWVLMGAALLIGLGMAWWLARQLGALQRYAHAVTAGERVAQVLGDPDVVDDEAAWLVAERAVHTGDRLQNRMPREPPPSPSGPDRSIAWIAIPPA